MRGDTLIEIQTRHLYAMKRKLKRLLPDHTIHLYHPIAQQKWIVRQTAEGDPISRRKSPKKGRLHDIFTELVRIPDLLLAPNLTLHVLLTEEETILRDDGQGSWRRKGWSNYDRLLLGVMEEAVLATAADYLALLPAGLPQPFSNKQLAEALSCQTRLAGRMTYTLRTMGLLQLAGKQGQANLFAVRP